MKKNIKYFKRWMALLLAVVLVAGTCVYSSSGSLRATDGVDPMTEEAASDVTEEETEPEVVVVSEGDETEPEEGETADINMPEEEPAAAEGEESTGKTEDAEEVPSEDGKTEEETTAEEKTEDEKAEEKTEEKLPEELAVEMPAQTLRATAEDGAAVKVSAPEGALPKGATVTISVVTDKDVLEKFVEAAESEGKIVADIKIYDVTIWDAEGNEIQPDASVEVTISNTGMEGDDASVFHADDESAPVKKVADIDDANHASFEAEHFSPEAVVVYADEESVYEYDEEISLNSSYSTDLNKHILEQKVSYIENGCKWEIQPNEGIIEITSENKEAAVIAVSGKKPGTATVKMSTDDGKVVVIYHITVKITTATSPIYVYVKLDGMEGNNATLSQETLDKLKALGLKVNGSGWCTVGRIEKASIDTPDNDNQASEIASEQVQNAIIEQINAGEMESFVENKLDLSAVDWNKKSTSTDDYGLVWVNWGADDYVPTGKTWHLNGYLDVSELPYTIKYVDKDTGKDIGGFGPVEGKAKFGDKIEAKREEIPGYKYVESIPENDTLEIGLTNNIITLYYEKQKSSVKISKSATDENGNGIGTAKVGDTIYYAIEVENTGDLDISKMAIVDTMFDAAGQIKNAKINGVEAKYEITDGKYIFVIDKLERVGNNDPNKGSKIATITYTYKVQDEDAGKTIKNTAVKKDPNIVLEGTTETPQVTIEKKPLTVTPKSGIGTYTGGYQIITGFEGADVLPIPHTGLTGICVKDNNKDYFIYGLKAGASGKDVGEYESIISQYDDVKVFDENGNEVTERFDVVVEGEGKLKINPQDVVLRSASLQKEYDGTPLSNVDIGKDGVVILDGETEISKEQLTNNLVEEKGWAPGEGATYSFANSVRYPNEKADNTFTYTLKEGTKSDNYNITCVPGTLSITNRNAKYQVTLLTNSGNFDYDGMEHEVTGFAEKENVEVDGDIIKVQLNGQTFFISGLTAFGKGKTVTDYPKESGGYPVMASGTPKVVDADGKDVSGQFNIEYDEGLVTINERLITITAGTQKYKYTGDEFFADEMDKPAEITEGKLAENQNYGAKVSGSQRLVGENDSYILPADVTITDKDGKNVTGNYKITLKPGKIIVTDGTPDDKVKEELVIKKTAEKTAGYKPGEIAEFTISVTNIFNKTMDVDLEELLPGAQFDEYKEKTSVIEKVIDWFDSDSKKTIQIEAGKTVDVKAFYKVTQEDILNKEFTNKVRATINGKDYDAEKKVETEAPDTKLTITKAVASIKNAEGADVDKPNLGDTIEYSIEVENKGNLILENVVLKDELPGVEFKELDGTTEDPKGTVNIGTLGINGHKKFTAVYTVTEQDILQGSVTNVAAVIANSPDGTAPDESASVVTETAPINSDYTVTKTVANPQTIFRVGNTIEYLITVSSTNDTNVTLKNIVVTDRLANASGPVRFTGLNGHTLNADNTVTIAELAPGAATTLRCEYTVQRTDAGRNITNTAIASPDNIEFPDPDKPGVDPGDEQGPSDPANVENIYDLIIHYVYADGTTAAPDVTGQYLEGETYGYASPTIAGYTPNYAFMRSDANGMPARRVELTVTYTAVPGTPTTPTPTADTPTTTPVPPTPIVVVPGTTTPVPTPTPVLIGEEEVPLGGEVALDDNGDVTVVPVEDEEVPLANRDLDDHACCLFHFLLAVATIIIYAFFTKSMKKRQAKVNELKDQLETELLKRKLGIADDKDQTV